MNNHQNFKNCLNTLALCIIVTVCCCSCAELGVELVAQTILAHYHGVTDDEDINLPITPEQRKRPPISLTEKFFLSADRTNHYLAGVRIIPDFEDKADNFPLVNRIEIAEKYWFKVLFSDTPESEELRKAFNQLDGQRVTIPLIHDELLTDDLKKNFNYQDFLEFNKELESNLSKVIVFDNNLIAYYNKKRHILLLVLLPRYSFAKINNLFYEYNKSRNR
ncbi:hypothetical protein JXQ70_04910 [bacterium]|nr:hypothetical protein [bacterium]